MTDPGSNSSTNPSTHHSADDRMASRLLQHATTDLTPDVDRLVSHGISRGRGLRRRRRVGTSLAAAAVIGVIGVAASVGPDLVGGNASAPGPGFADQTSTTPEPEPSPSATTTQVSVPLPIDASLAVPATQVPGTFDELLTSGTPGEVLETDSLPFLDRPEHQIVHFLWDGTLTTFIIEPADNLATCEELVDPVNQANGEPGGECVFIDGLETLTYGPETADGVTSQGAMVWQHGYIVTANSHNAADGKDVAPVTAQPPIALDDLIALASSQVWFEER